MWLGLLFVQLNRQFLFLLNFPAFVHDPGNEDNQQADEEGRSAQVHIVQGGLQLIVNQPVYDEVVSERMNMTNILG